MDIHVVKSGETLWALAHQYNVLPASFSQVWFVQEDSYQVIKL